MKFGVPPRTPPPRSAPAKGYRWETGRAGGAFFCVLFKKNKLLCLLDVDPQLCRSSVRSHFDNFDFDNNIEILWGGHLFYAILFVFQITKIEMINITCVICE